MSLDKVAQLAETFAIKIAESLLAQGKKPLSLKERSQMKGHGPSNLMVDDNDLKDEKIWERAEKTVKKYWNKYDDPWAVVQSVYKQMGGKSKKKKK